MRRAFESWTPLTVAALGVYVLGTAACGSSSSPAAIATGSPEASDGDGGVLEAPPVDEATAPGDDDAQATGGDSRPSAADAAVAGPNGGYPAGWLYTSGNAIMQSRGPTGTPWMGRGVNTDDVFFCGYNNTLYLTKPDMIEETMLGGLVTDWKPNFIRLSLAMRSYTTTASWFSNPAQYKTPVTAVIDALGANPGVYVLVTVRSDASMIVGDPNNQDPTWIPSDSTNTPDKTKYPTGTDGLYVALVDAFAQSKFVLFGISNEPGGTVKSDAVIGAAMNHAVGTIRAEEDKLGVPHHLVSVQGNGYSSDLSLYGKTPNPITHDNVVYELHYYPSSTGQTPSSYALAATLPVIIGEYGAFTSSVPQSGFYADMEAKHISSLAWDFEAYSDCAPDLLNVTHDATMLQPTAWGTTVKTYLTAHAN